MRSYANYAKSLRETLHMYPEIGFDLPKTLALVRGELEKMGIEHTEKWGRSSVVGYIGKEDAPITIGLRADMDALPIQEVIDSPIRSRHDGMMHACGHDVHTAILLATAKWLKDHEDQLRCRVKLLFTPAEEYITPGCKELAENGVMDDVDFAITAHVDPETDTDRIISCLGNTYANSIGFKCRFYGTPAHASVPQMGHDAIMMAVQAIGAMQNMVYREIDPSQLTIFNIGSFHAGNTNNIVCGYAELFGTVRAFEDSVTDHLTRRLEEITASVAAMNGGRGEFEIVKMLPHVVNDDRVVEQIRRTCDRVLGPGHYAQRARRAEGEDFGFLSRKKPCGQFHIGIKPPEQAEALPPLHSDHFQVDDRCFETGIKMFTGFVLDAMDGIDGM